MAGEGAQREGRAAEGHGLAAQLRRDGVQQLQKRIRINRHKAGKIRTGAWGSFFAPIIGQRMRYHVHRITLSRKTTPPSVRVAPHLFCFLRLDFV
jgi:hypothetical protein